MSGRREYSGNIGDSEEESLKIEIDKGVVHLELFLGEPEHYFDCVEFAERVGAYAQKLLKSPKLRIM